MADRVRRPSGPSGPEREDAPGQPQRAPDHRVTHLQRQVGNRVARQFVQALAIQRVKEGDGPSQDVGIIQQQLNHVGATPRVAITGRFDAPTTTAAKSFQKKLIAEGVKGITEDGVVAGATHDQLKLRAPSVDISNNLTVEDGPANNYVNSDPTKGMHGAPLALKAKGVGVKELQERLNSSKKAGKALSVDGSFGPKTDAALKLFQSSVPMAATGVADPTTWAKLETAGAATQGHVEFDWREEVEGVRAGTKASYDWKLTKTAMNISVDINFQKMQKGVDTRIGQWLSDIKEIWSTFRAVNESDPKKKTMNLNFEAKRASAGRPVKVFQFDPKITKKADRFKSRSDASTWYTIDSRRSMAPHEFGHLIGLADEYNRTEEHYVDVTGEEPALGDPAGVLADATKMAAAIKAELPLTDVVAVPPVTEDPLWGTKLAAVIAPLGGKQGGFSRLVAQEYAKANGGASVYADIKAAFEVKNVVRFQLNKSASVTPFLYSNNSLMGSMLTTPKKGGGGKGADPHEHPIEPRHVQPFVTMLAKEWAMQTGKADVWKPERR